MARILGIDPGSRVTGFGLIDTGIGTGGRKAVYVASGCVRSDDPDLARRLKTIFEGLRAVIAEHRPDEAVIENVFVKRNIESALKLGQARGAAITALATHGLSVHAYTPAQIKLAIAGKGNAAKAQIQHMVRALLNLPAAPQADAADALACALCHSHTNATLSRLARRGASWREQRL
jgi:crossover junction endodeoxyribonuclease RuvC